MTGGIDRNEGALWRRWRETEVGAVEQAELEPLVLAAYAENRLGRPGVDPETDPEFGALESWLALHPDAVADLAAARNVNELDRPEFASAAVLARAQALVTAPQPGIVAFHRKPAKLRSALTWSSIAAGLIAASLVGFSLGLDDWLSLIGNGQNVSIEQELIGPTTPVLPTYDEENGL